MSQVLGTFSGQGGHFQITTNGISFVDDKPDGHVEDRGFLSQNQFEKIPVELINQCNDNFETTGIPYIILDVSDRDKFSKLRGEKDEERDIKIDSLLNTKFEVVSWYELLEMPSRQTFYDSVTQHTDLFERHKVVMNFLNLNGFQIVDLLESGLSQQELLYNSLNREISYICDSSLRIIIRVKPNLMIEVLVLPHENDSVEVNKRYFFFYNPSQIISILSETLNIDEKRDLKLKNILI
jgi:hypothetical protein